jgi:hypothetical protein
MACTLNNDDDDDDDAQCLFLGCPQFLLICFSADLNEEGGFVCPA